MPYYRLFTIYFFRTKYRMHPCDSSPSVVGMGSLVVIIPSFLLLALVSSVLILLPYSFIPLISHISSSQSSFVMTQRAYGDGLTAENLPPASIGDREASLFVKINPPILTNESKQDAYLQFRLFNEKNNQTIQHVTYDIAISKANA